MFDFMKFIAWYLLRRLNYKHDAKFLVKQYFKVKFHMWENIFILFLC